MPADHQYLADLVEFVDDRLAGHEVPLYRRPLVAALEIADKFVVDVSEGSVEDPIGQRWFDSLCRAVIAWYRERYQDALDSEQDSSAKGLIVFRGAALGLTIPLTIVCDDKDPGFRWVQFPTDLLSSENVFSFMDSQLGFSVLRRQESDALRDKIGSVVMHVRSLNMNLVTADLDDSGKNLAYRVLPILYQAASDIVSGDVQRRALGAWNINLAVELTLKIYINQSHGKAKYTHSVSELYENAVESGLPTVRKGVLKVFPTGKKVIRYRYGEITGPSVAQSERLYEAGLSLCAHVAENLRRHVVMENAAFKIRAIG